MKAMIICTMLIILCSCNAPSEVSDGVASKINIQSPPYTEYHVGYTRVREFVTKDGVKCLVEIGNGGISCDWSKP